MERCFDFTMFPVSFVFFSSSFLCLRPHLVVSNLEKVMSVVLGGFGCWLVCIGNIVSFLAILPPVYLSFSLGF